MLLSFFFSLRQFNIPVSTREFLDCLSILEARLALFDLEDFYVLSRVSLVKDERFYDRFDRAFAHYFSALDEEVNTFASDDSLQSLRHALTSIDVKVSAAELDRLLVDYKGELRSREVLDAEFSDVLGEPVGSSFLGNLESENETGIGDEKGDKKNEASDSTPYAELKSESEEGLQADDTGHGGEGEQGEQGEQGDGCEDGDDGDEGEEGDRGQRGKGNDGIEGLGESELGEQGEKQDFEQLPKRRASKLWAQRRFNELDADVELGTRNLKMALRRLRKFARTGAELELDLHSTIANTARNAGMLDIVEIPERHNSVKVLLFLDVGGSMDEHVELCEQLFAAAKYEFKFLEYYYFHNFVYENVWSDAERRDQDRVSMLDLIRKFSSDYKIIFVGDADMARHEIAERGGSVEHFNAEPGQVWFERIQRHFRKTVWLNPSPESRWQDSYSATMIKRLTDDKMFTLSVEGIDQAARCLTK